MDSRQYIPEQAIGRLLDYYQYVMAVAAARIASHSLPPVPAAPPFALPDLADHGQALARARAQWRCFK